jgi:hypothetical protein
MMVCPLAGPSVSTSTDARCQVKRSGRATAASAVASCTNTASWPYVSLGHRGGYGVGFLGGVCVCVIAVGQEAQVLR